VRGAFFFATQKTFDIHVGQRLASVLISQRSAPASSSLSQLPLTVEAARSRSPDFVGRSDALGSMIGRGGLQVNKTGRKPSKNNGKAKKMAMARKPVASARRATGTVQPGAAKSTARPHRDRKMPPAAITPSPLQSGAAAGDDTVVIALSLPEVKLSDSMAAYFRKCKEKLGFVPNVLKAYAFDMTKLEAFVAMYNDLMLGPSALNKTEREMIAVAVSSQNRCYYCLVAHGAAVRQHSGDPILGELMVMNYRTARLSKRQRAMLDFAVKLTSQPWTVEEGDRERLRRAGFSDRDIWDISAVAGFFNMTNRVASATDMRPNSAYHAIAR
jgi:uncharacterized peroxidase-related enzyme